MRRETRNLLLIFFGSILAVVGAIVAVEVGSSRGGAVSVDNPASYRIGPDSAKVKVVEFSDYQCPACKSIESHLKTLITSYGDQVQLVYRNFPLPQHKNAMAASLAAEAAVRDLTSEYATLKQIKWTSSEEKNVELLTKTKTEQVKALLAEHGDVTLHFTPAYSSWLNQIEGFFGILTKQSLSGTNLRPRSTYA